MVYVSEDGMPFLSLLTDACESLGIDLPDAAHPRPRTRRATAVVDDESLVVFASREGASVEPHRAASAADTSRRRPAQKMFRSGDGSSIRRRRALAHGGTGSDGDEAGPRISSNVRSAKERRADDLYRRALGHFAKGRVEEGVADLLLARVFDPANVTYRKSARFWRAELTDRRRCRPAESRTQIPSEEWT